jgi:tRNA-dihydrouridine synthase 2
MIATAAESNPTVFSPTPFVDLERTFIPSYLRLVRVNVYPALTPLRHLTSAHIQSHYLQNHFSLTKFCVSQFKSTHEALKKAGVKKFRETLSQAKSWDELDELAGGWNHDWRELEEIRTVVETREDTVRMVFVPMELAEPDLKGDGERMEDIDEDYDSLFKTPTDRLNPEPPSSRAPLGPSNERMYFIPAGISGRDATTPSPSGPRVRLTRNQKMKLDKCGSCGLLSVE